MPTPRPVDALDRLWTGCETHIAMVAFAYGAACHYCHTGPAYVYLREHLLCGVCWNKVMWLKWAREGMG